MKKIKTRRVKRDSFHPYPFSLYAPEPSTSRDRRLFPSLIFLLSSTGRPVLEASICSQARPCIFHPVRKKSKNPTTHTHSVFEDRERTKTRMVRMQFCNIPLSCCPEVLAKRRDSFQPIDWPRVAASKTALDLPHACSPAPASQKTQA